jgi:hypothetical protein
MSNIPQSIPGMPNATIPGLLAGNPKDSSALYLSQTANKLSLLNKAVGGRKRYSKGGANMLYPALFPMYYTPQNGPSQSPNAIIQNISKNSAQQNANMAYDKFATMKGGNSNWKWGCYSGGKNRKRTMRRYRRKSKTYQKHRKTQKHHRKHKTNKTK